MKVSELARMIDAKSLTPAVQEDKEVLCGYTCDLLSWVMAHIHMNVIAVAVLAEMACVILPENIEMPPESLKKAEDEGLTVLQSSLTAFAICGRMAAAGIPDKA